MILLAAGLVAALAIALAVAVDHHDRRSGRRRRRVTHGEIRAAARQRRSANLARRQHSARPDGTGARGRRGRFD
jgi:hypothetical protein